MERIREKKKSLGNTNTRIDAFNFILLAYSHPKETGSATMRLHKNTKAIVRSSDGNTDFFDVVTIACKEMY